MKIDSTYNIKPEFNAKETTTKNVEKTSKNSSTIGLDNVKKTNIPESTTKSQIGFVDGHVNDITILAATNIKEFAYTWMTGELMKNWKKDEPIDAAIEKTSKSTGNSQHPTIFKSVDAHAQIKTKNALIIGNSDYNMNGQIDLPKISGDLPDVKTKDLPLVTKAFNEHGYNTTIKENLTGTELEKNIKDAIAKCAPGDELVIYYSGHGNFTGLSGVQRKAFKDPQYLNLFSYDLFNSEINDLIKDATQKGIKIVYILDSCLSGRTTEFVRDRHILELKSRLDDIESNIKKTDSKDKAEMLKLVNQSKENLKQAEQLMDSEEKIKDKKIRIKVDGKSENVEPGAISNYYKQNLARKMELELLKDNTNVQLKYTQNMIKLTKETINIHKRLISLGVKDVNLEKDENELKLLMVKEQNLLKEKESIEKEWGNFNKKEKDEFIDLIDDSLIDKEKENQLNNLLNRGRNICGKM